MKKAVLLLLLNLPIVGSQAASSSVRMVDTSRDAMKFLEELCTSESNGRVIDVPVPGWVNKDDVRKLIVLIDSSRPCSSVALSASSYIRERSTQGDEAAFLIEGFREGQYPPRLNSAELSDADRDELRQWWEDADDGANRGQ